MVIAFGMEFVAIVTLNALTIIVYLKEYGRRKRSMYLVINLAFVDMLVSYSSIAVKIACGSQSHHDGVASRERKLTKTLFIVTIASLTLTQLFIIFWILDTVSSHTFTAISHQTWFRLYYCFGSLFFANSLVNPICYGFRIPEFRRALFSLFRCRFLPQPAQVFRLNKF